jgi:hypothetical protein
MIAPRLHATLLTALLTLALGAQAAHAADEDDEINPDRPNVANSSDVVGRGRTQLEIGANWDRQRNGDVHTRTLTTPTLLRIGTGETVELRVETEGRSIEHAVDTASGAHATTAGWVDTSVGFKWHALEQDGARPSLGLIGEVKLPTGSTALRGTGVRPQFELPAEWDLPQGWSLALMPGLGSDADDNGTHYGYGLLAASLGKDLSERAKGFVELAAPQIAHAAHGGTQNQVDAGVSWLVNKDCQLDAMAVHGLNKNTPGLSLAFGVSIRR